MWGKPAYFLIVHQAAAELPKYRNMEEIGGRERVSLSGGTMGDVLGARPIAGRVAEDMNTVAMANLEPAQRKSFAPALDAAEPIRDLGHLSPGQAILAELRAKRRGAETEGYANMSPGQKILFELRACRGAQVRQ